MTLITPRPEELASDALIGALRALVEDGTLTFPPLGHGRTAGRLGTLAGIAAEDLGLARIAEAHLDAVTILREAGATPDPGALYGVWASDTPSARLHLTRLDGHAVLAGSKAFCTGAGLLDRALVTVHDDDRVHLVDLDLRGGGICVDASSWVTPAFAATQTASITVDPTDVVEQQFIGSAGWYTERIGFWHGALAPAACWAGGAIGLVDHCLRMAGTADEHRAAHLGMLDSTRWALDTIVRAAGDAVDMSPHDHDHATRLAYRARTAIERCVTEVVDHAIRSFGPRLLANDAWAARRVTELQLYVRQHGDTRDHATLGRMIMV